ncbi:MAG TPA: DnaJ C-terminal domain-containing protein [Opitutaceae bacterium]|nr:DnaJ C-terminal domain-containing protein [Opitutaceae bacterium]
MPVEFKDYYATLGVTRDATDDDIKKAFRRLARQYHPDVAKDKKAAEEKFKEINEANEVLSDPVKRKKYDELGAHWQEEGGTPSARGWEGRGAQGTDGGQAREFHFTGTGFSDFFEQFFGGGSRFGFESGGRDFEAESRTPGRRGADVEGEILVTLAEVMHGTVRMISLQSIDPRTAQAETQSFQVRIPAGAMEGRRIRVPGKGEPGAGGAPAGDLYLRVRYAAHPDFRARGADLYHDADLAPWEAVLGTTVVAPSFEGAIKVRIPPATNPGAQLRVRGHGLPKGRSGARGDLYVVIHLQVPPRLTEKERTLWEELSRTSRFKPREPS